MSETLTSETFFPLGARPVPILLIFIGLLVVFDLLLVRWLKLGKIAWKRVDYIWLSVAAVGLLGSSMEARRVIAELSVPAMEDEKNDAYDQVRLYVDHLRGTAVCRVFDRTELSPPDLATIQREYDAVCEYGRRVAASLPTTLPERLAVSLFAGRPRVADQLLKRHYAELDDMRSRFEDADREYDRTVSIAKRSGADMTVALLAPILLAIALALRITKVTGEIRLDATGPEGEADQAKASESETTADNGSQSTSGDERSP